MKILALGDIHGRSTWKHIILNNTFDKIIFIGDYFDSFNIAANQQLENFLDIIQYKKDNPDKVILLFGNHDFHYIVDGQTYSGYQETYSHQIKHIIKENLEHMQMCFIHEKYLFVHAGVTKTWCENNDIDMNQLESSINDLFTYQPYRFRFTFGKYHNVYGDEICQTPIWVRPKSLLEDRIDYYIQVVGHTQQKKLIITDDIILIDTLEDSGEFLQIIDGIASSNKFNFEDIIK